MVRGIPEEHPRQAGSWTLYARAVFCTVLVDRSSGRSAQQLGRKASPFAEIAGPSAVTGSPHAQRPPRIAKNGRNAERLTRPPYSGLEEWVKIKEL